MKYAVIACTNGNFNIHSEHGENMNAAFTEFHSYSAALYNDPATTKATIKVVDEDYETVGGKIEKIEKSVEPQVEAEQPEEA